MTWLRALDELVVDVLSTRAETLEHWRQQVPTGGNRVKNFENWLLVELVHRLRQADADPIKTNGYVEGWRLSYWTEGERFSALQEAISAVPGISYRLAAPGTRN
jgi:hypothetical protein